MSSKRDRERERSRFSLANKKTHLDPSGLHAPVPSRSSAALPFPRRNVDRAELAPHQYRRRCLLPQRLLNRVPLLLPPLPSHLLNAHPRSPPSRTIHQRARRVQPQSIESTSVCVDPTLDGRARGEETGGDERGGESDGLEVGRAVQVGLEKREGGGTEADEEEGGEVAGGEGFRAELLEEGEELRGGKRQLQRGSCRGGDVLRCQRGI